MNLKDYSRVYKKFGTAALLTDLFSKGLNQVTYYKNLVGMTLELESLDPTYLAIPDCFTGRFLTREELLQYAQDPQNDMPPSFLEYAFAKQDQCYGLLYQDQLAAYGWYSNLPTRLSHELSLHFDNAWMYMYRGYTRKEFRGKRLHAVGMANALKRYTDLGFRGLISYVEANNFSSLRSVFRMGYKEFGHVYIVKVWGSFFFYRSSSCDDYGFYITSNHESESTWDESVFAK